MESALIMCLAFTDYSEIIFFRENGLKDSIGCLLNELCNNMENLANGAQ